MGTERETEKKNVACPGGGRQKRERRVTKLRNKGSYYLPEFEKKKQRS